jgi:transcriptional regulator of acetoin/glycerol metabolism
VTLSDLPEDIAGAVRPAETMAQGGPALRDYELTALKSAIEAEHGNLTRAAVRLGIAKSTLYEKLKRHGLSRA